ncbi:peptidase M14 [Serratia proteamaculans]|uniref:peptidase M14 n=1 Tax=Serratia proteamaculans TaxID=28151 RepID=UPI0021783225|nr:peptidase M14 [Serratia proteamaculans]CAI1908562.1 Uncharacterised protein [Serratia proteamaculans]
MAVTWIDVIDNAVKIGLGSLIALLSGWLTLKLTQHHEIKREAKALLTEEMSIKTNRYIEFLTMSHSLMQTYLFTQCSGSSGDYLKYLRIHNEITITSDDEIRLAAFELQSAVSSFIVYNKSGERELVNSLRKLGTDKAAIFQYMAYAELLKMKEDRKNI